MRLRPLEVNREPLAALESVFEANPELGLYPTEVLAAEAGHDQGAQFAGADAEPVPQLECDQTLSL